VDWWQELGGVLHVVVAHRSMIVTLKEQETEAGNVPVNMAVTTTVVVPTVNTSPD